MVAFISFLRILIVWWFMVILKALGCSVPALKCRCHFYTTLISGGKYRIAIYLM